MSFATHEIREAVVFLGAAGLIVPIINRMRVSPALGFLAVGLIVGPFGLGRLAETIPWVELFVIEDKRAVRFAAEFGVIFLLFMIGLELSLERLRAMWRIAFLVGGAQVLLSAAGIAAIAFYSGYLLDVAIVLGSAFAMSSTAIIMHLLTEAGRLGAPAGQTSFGVLLFQDLAVVPILFMVSAFGLDANAVGPAIALALGKAILVIIVILGVGRLIARPLFGIVAGARSRELFLATVLLTIIGAAASADAADFSPALGAFLAGLLLADTEYRPRIAVDIEPFKGLLLGVFFVAVGLSIEFAELIADWDKILAWAFGVMALKAVCVYALVRLAGQAPCVAFETAALLAPIGEFSFVVSELSLSLGVIYEDTAQFALIVASLTMAMAPLMALSARWLVSRFAARGEPETFALFPDQISDHVIVVGYGRVGREIGALLDNQEIAHVAIDLDARRVAGLRAQGFSIYHGDARQYEILSRLGVEQAAALVVTMDDAKTTLQTVKAAHRDWPDLPIFARVRDEAHANALLKAGAKSVILEAREAALQLGETVLVGVGLPESVARDLVAERRLITQASSASGKALPIG
ncbi:cation:proton antiporter [Methylocystis sp. L43]|uniref:cation:proton antiporter domain-containing protein n=1 Tax=unclassified Methylocystis TaxID=2625913 RepID=UPI0018C1D229|nr:MULTISPECIES: cation:proton antiporter [unclassified Methylocystis]MBG0796585.1 cation:proton antiporter [Methylocystis sp. L43]MBG0804532.1 cation:proton antiporter [Methylocystis sp. H15]